MVDTTLVHDALPTVRLIPASRTLRRFARANAAMLSIVLATLLVVGDSLTGVDSVFTLLYLVPIGVAVWWRGRAMGIAISALCVSGALGSDALARLDQGRILPFGTMAWNHGASLAIFALVGELVIQLRAYVDRDEQARRTTVEQLRQAERLGVIGKLAAGIAHELGTPLNVIVGHAELIDAEGVSRASLHQSSKVILVQAEKMTTIIRGLLDFSRRAGGERVAVDLGALARAAATLLKPVARKKDIDIDVQAKTDGGAMVHGNPTELEQVVVNLMMNGIQSMSGGGTLRVRVLTPRVHGDPHASVPPPALSCVEIEDEGGGIAPESLPKIFDPFYTTKDVGEGTGLGLSVSYGIVSDHGGRIEVASSLGSGSRFTVYLPLALGEESSAS